jgi:hypothetical protein
MVRIGLALYMLVITAVSPWLCCCHAAPPAASSTTKQAAPAKHSCCACCEHEKPAVQSARCDHLASAPRRGCHCQAERPQVILAVPAKGASTLNLTAISSFLCPPSAHLSSVLATGVGEEICTFYCCRDLLTTLHILRC